LIETQWDLGNAGVRFGIYILLWSEAFEPSSPELGIHWEPGARRVGASHSLPSRCSDSMILALPLPRNAIKIHPRVICNCWPLS